MKLSNTELRLHRGCIAYLSVLGGKNLWKHLGSFDAMTALSHLLDQGGNTDAPATEDTSTQENKILFFGETLAITSINTNDDLTDEEVYQSCLKEVVTQATAVIRAAALLRFPLVEGDKEHPLGENYPLAYRGCISLGRLIASDGVLVGKAVDVAALNSAKAECALLWMDKDTAELYKTSLRGLDKELDSLLLKYEVPVTICKKNDKKGHIRSYAVNYLSPGDQIKPLKLAKRVLASFDRTKDNEGVKAKKKHTKAFFEKAVKAVVEGVHHNVDVPVTTEPTEE